MAMSAAARSLTSVVRKIRCENRGFVGLGDFCFFDFAVEIFADGVERAVEIFLVDVAKDGFIAGLREDMRDAVAHSARAENGDGFDCVD